jgi:hypothetical protein
MSEKGSRAAITLILDTGPPVMEINCSKPPKAGNLAQFNAGVIGEGLEQTNRSAPEDHHPRSSRMGSRVLTSARSHSVATFRRLQSREISG